MASETVALVLEGDPTLDDLTTALDGFRDLLAGLVQAVPGGQSVTWVVEELVKSSAAIAVRGVGEDRHAIERVASAYLDVARAVRLGGEVADPLRPSIIKMMGILNGRVPSLRFETADDDVTLDAGLSVAPARFTSSEVYEAYGAVEGRVQTLSNRGSLRFTLYDLLYDKAVSCYLDEDQRDVMTDAWGKVAVVRGWVKRDPVTGRPRTVRRVRAVSLIDEGRPGDWREAEGVLSGYGNDEPSEVVIRRQRDGW